MKFKSVLFVSVMALSLQAGAAEPSSQEQLKTLDTLVTSAIEQSDKAYELIQNIESTGLTAEICLNVGRTASVAGLISKYVGTNPDWVTASAQINGSVDAFANECKDAPLKVGKYGASIRKQLWVIMSSHLAWLRLAVGSELNK